MTKPPTDPDENSVDLMLLFPVETDIGLPNGPERAPTPEAETFVESPNIDQSELPAAPVTTDMRAWDERLCEVERALEQSATEIRDMKAQLATLVVSVTDMSARRHERVGAAVPPSAPLRSARVPRTGSYAAFAWLAATVAVVALVVWFLQSDTAQTPVPALEPLQAAGDRPENPAVALPEDPAAGAEERVSAGDPGTADRPAPRIGDVEERPTAETETSPPAASTPPPRRVVSQASQPAAPAPARLARFVGTLSIASVPADATVFLNRELVGTAPVLLEGLRAGSHLIWVEREGYRRWTRVVLVPADQATRVSVELESLPRP